VNYYTPASSSGGLPAILSIVIPILGLVLWVALLPSTRRLLKKRWTAITSLVSPDPAPADPAGGSADLDAETSSPRRREDDPEILGFDSSLILKRLNGDKSA
jgi:hypothetical protein